MAAFEIRLESNIFDLKQELEAGSYRPKGYSSFYIHDPKHRLISAAPFRDRVVHHAVVNILQPIYERVFIGGSYANRKGKGTHKAIDSAQRFSRCYPYVLQCDLEQFFPSIDHQILRDLLGRKILDGQVMALIDEILRGGDRVLEDEYRMVYFDGDDLFAANRPRGLPIGNLTSQFWANVLLDQLDQHIKRRLRCRGYVRYVDDFLLFHHDKKQLWHWKAEIREFLATLRLTLHERRSTVYPVRTGIPFLGFRVYPAHRRLKRRNVVAFGRRLRRHQRRLAAGELPFEDYLRRVRGWIAHARHGDTWSLRRSLLRSPITVARRAVQRAS